MNAWYLRKANGKEFGPESIETLVKWAEQSRIIAGNKISKDKKQWQLVEHVEAMNICHIAILPDKTVYGPFNVLATQELIEHNVFTSNTIIVNKKNGKEISAADFLKQNKKKIKTKAPKKNLVQKDFELLSTPESELLKNSKKNEKKNGNTTNDQNKTPKRKAISDKMESKKQEFLFKDDEDFSDDLQYVVDDDAQIEMPFKEVQINAYNEDNFPKPSQNNTIFISKDTERFPEFVTKENILTIDDSEPLDAPKQTKMSDKNNTEHLDNHENKIMLEDDDDKDKNNINNNTTIEDDNNNNNEFAKNTPVKHNLKNKNIQELSENNTEIDELKIGLETTTKLFVQQQAENEKKIKSLTAERNKLEQEVALNSDTIKDLKEINQNLETSLKKIKLQLTKNFEQIDDKNDFIQKLEEDHLKTQNSLDVDKEKIKELLASKKDMTLALAAERDKIQKQETLTLQYKKESEEAEKKEDELLQQKNSLETTNKNLMNKQNSLEEKIKTIEINHIQTIKNLEEKLIAIRQELKAEEVSEEEQKKEIKELQSKIKSTDTIVNERMRSINEQTIRASTKYKQECRLTEKLMAKNKKMLVSIIILLLIIIIFGGILSYILTIKTSSQQDDIDNIPIEHMQKNAFDKKNIGEPQTRLLSENIDLVGAKTYTDGKLVKVVFDEAIFSKLSSPSAFAIKNTRQNLMKYKKYLNDYHMVIEGHTDDSPLTGNPQYKDNKELGHARAESFKQLLVISFGLPNQNISTVSAGSENPPFSNSSQKGREQNKTVVLYFKNK